MRRTNGLCVRARGVCYSTRAGQLDSCIVLSIVSQFSQFCCSCSFSLRLRRPTPCLPCCHSQRLACTANMPQMCTALQHSYHKQSTDLIAQIGRARVCSLRLCPLPFQHSQCENLAMAKFTSSRRVVPVWDTLGRTQISKAQVPVLALRTPESNSNTISH